MSDNEEQDAVGDQSSPTKSGHLSKEKGAELNHSFTEYLQLTEEACALVRKYRVELLHKSDQFIRDFYRLLMSSEATARFLQHYQERGGNLQDLARAQLNHLSQLLLGEVHDSNAEQLTMIGRKHNQFGIEPAWVMGAYFRYLEFLKHNLNRSQHIPEEERPLIESTLVKLVHRDMALMMEGYWNSTLDTAQRERRKLSILQGRINSMLENIPQMLWSVNASTGKISYLSPSFRGICGNNPRSPVPCLDRIVGDDRERVLMAWEQAMIGQKSQLECRIRGIDNNTRWYRMALYPVTNLHQQVIRIDAVMEDATATRQTMAQLHAMATTDALTGLINRTLLLDRLRLALAMARRQPDTEVALILMDLDQFKQINETLGHPAGDDILTLVARRIHDTLRESDTFARLGDDEFAVLITENQVRERAGQVARKIHECLNQPIQYNGNELYLGISMGIALHPEHGEDVDSLMNRADVALQSSKNRGMDYTFYDAGVASDTSQKLQMTTELRHAINGSQLEVYYQPKINMASGRIEGAEALLRWKHPAKGLVAPDAFIPLAESTGLIRPITDWVMQQVSEQNQRWREAGYDLRIAINLSGRVFQDSNLVNRISTLLRLADDQPDCFELEITENELMSDVKHVSQVLHKLSDLGVSIAIDDFGTGYSSLAYLKSLPLHTLKIDKSFVMDMTQDENDAVIVRSMIDLAHNLGRNVIAEGIEDRDTWQLLSMLGCDGAQGYFISKPLPIHEFDHWIRRAPWNVRTTTPVPPKPPGRPLR